MLRKNNARNHEIWAEKQWIIALLLRFWLSLGSYQGKCLLQSYYYLDCYSQAFPIRFDLILKLILSFDYETKVIPRQDRSWLCSHGLSSGRILETKNPPLYQSMSRLSKFIIQNAMFYWCLLYKIEWFIDFSAINKIDNLTSVIIYEYLTCVDYRETHYSLLLYFCGAIGLFFI